MYSDIQKQRFCHKFLGMPGMQLRQWWRWTVQCGLNPYCNSFHHDRKKCKFWFWFNLDVVFASQNIQQNINYFLQLEPIKNMTFKNAGEVAKSINLEDILKKKDSYTSLKELKSDISCFAHNLKTKTLNVNSPKEIKTIKAAQRPYERTRARRSYVMYFQ